jgi:hypothetical protein
MMEISMEVQGGVKLLCVGSKHEVVVIRINLCKVQIVIGN